MATTSTIAAVKAALLDEIQALSVTSAAASSPALVQVVYARPPADLIRSECVYFGSSMQTVGEIEQRMTSGRRRRLMRWAFDLVVSTQILADAEDAEARAFTIADAVEDWLAANPQPADWSTTPITSGSLYIVPVGWRVDHTENVEGTLRVDVTITLEMKERLT